MIDAWLDLPIPLMIIVASLVFGASAMLCNWVLHHSPIADWIGDFRGVVGPFFGAIAVLFALFLTFLASDVWEKKNRAWHVVQSESDALTALIALAATNQSAASQINDAVKGYITAVIEKEWPLMSQQQSSSEAAEQIDRLLQSVAAASSSYVPTVHDKMLQKVIAVREARAQRISLSNNNAEMLQWLGVVVLAFMTQLAIAMVHLDRSEPQRMALGVFSVAAVFTICVVAAYDRPFDGHLRISPDPLAEVLERLPPQKAQ